MTKLLQHADKMYAIVMAIGFVSALNSWLAGMYVSYCLALVILILVTSEHMISLRHAQGVFLRIALGTGINSKLISIMSDDFVSISIAVSILTHVLLILFFVRLKQKKIRSPLLKRPLLVLPWFIFVFAYTSFLMNTGNELFTSFRWLPPLWYLIASISLLSALNLYKSVKRNEFLLFSSAILLLFVSHIARSTVVLSNEFTHLDIYLSSLPFIAGLSAFWLLVKGAKSVSINAEE